MCRLCRIFEQKMNSNPETPVKCQSKVCSPIYLSNQFKNCVEYFANFLKLTYFFDGIRLCAGTDNKHEKLDEKNI